MHQELEIWRIEIFCAYVWFDRREDDEEDSNEETSEDDEEEEEEGDDGQKKCDAGTAGSAEDSVEETS